MTTDAPIASPKQETLARLARAAEEFAWIMSRVAPETELLGRPGEWNVRQVLAHMVMYEERYTLPTVRLMAAGQPANGIDVTGTESDLRVPSSDLVDLDARALHTRLREAEAERDTLVRAMSEEQFAMRLPCIWRVQSPQWVLEKAFGHIWEHGVTIFYITHFARYLRELRDRAEGRQP